jgi:hypothetical protein
VVLSRTGPLIALIFLLALQSRGADGFSAGNQIDFGEEGCFRITETRTHRKPGESLLEDEELEARAIIGSLWSHSLTRSKENLYDIRKLMDYEGLGFGENGSWIWHDVMNPVIDPVEIRKRQAAVREIHEGWETIGSVGNDLRDWYEMRSPGWFRVERNLPEMIPLDTDTWRLREQIEKKEERKYGALLVQELQGILRDLRYLEEILSRASAIRLVQIHSSLRRLFEEGAPLYDLEKAAAFKTSFVRTLEDLDAGRNHFAAGFQDLRRLLREFNLSFRVARHARENGWNAFPKILDRNPQLGPRIKIVNGVPTRYLREKGASAVVANSLEMDMDHGRVRILTGSNDSGKSTFIRMVVHFMVMASVGSPLPADSVELTPMSFILHTSPESDAAADDFGRLAAQADALDRQVTQRVTDDPFYFVIIDEVLSGTTSFLRGPSEKTYLNKLGNDSRALVIAVTHQWGSTRLEEYDPTTYRNFHLTADHEVRPGPMIDKREMLRSAMRIYAAAGWTKKDLENLEGEFYLENPDVQRP